MSQFSGLYHIRDKKAEDDNFILSTFLRGLYYGDSWFSLIPKDLFMSEYKRVVETLVARGNIKVACLPDDPDTIIGYSILSQDFQTVHWAYVKKNWRKNGVAKSLLPQHPTAVSHLTEVGKQLLPKLHNPIFNPFKLT